MIKCSQCSRESIKCDGFRIYWDQLEFTTCFMHVYVVEEGDMFQDKIVLCPDCIKKLNLQFETILEVNSDEV
jgi:hypothetical protein